MYVHCPYLVSIKKYVFSDDVFFGLNHETLQLICTLLSNFAIISAFNEEQKLSKVDKIFKNYKKLHQKSTYIL